jgi:hypothetical protein
MKNAQTKVKIKDWEWSRCKGHCGACPDALIPFPFDRNLAVMEIKQRF